MLKRFSWEELMRAPGKEARHLQSQEIIDALFNNQIVNRNQKTGFKAPIFKCQVNAVHPKGIFILQPGDICFTQAGTIADNETSFTAIFVF